jgi:large subunit ribosomal protein L4
VASEGHGKGESRKFNVPLWPGGGVAHGPKPRVYHISVPKKVRKSALRSALTTRYQESNVKVLDKLELETISTKNFNAIVKGLSLSKPLVVVDGKDEVLERSARNIPYVKVLRVEGLNVYDVIRHEQFVVTLDAVKRIEEALLP